jgi:bifunctional non-homologous end joining protein LigD
METILPMLAKAGSLPANAADYAYEIKWDGLRAILYIENDQMRILSRNNNNITKQYPELFAIKSELGSHNIILDGEIIHLSKEGRPSFSGLQHRMGLTSMMKIAEQQLHYPVTYIIFDLLSFNNKKLIDLPYHKRRNTLDRFHLFGPNWQTPSFMTGNGKDNLEATRKLGLEGILAKRFNSRYTPGKRSNDWIKIKNKMRQEFVIGGWLPGQNARSGTIGSLLVGYYNIPRNNANAYITPQKLLYAGKVGTGFTNTTLSQLKTLLLPLQRNATPFCIQTPQNAIFVEPNLVGEFEFTEWTTNNTLRHPSFKGLRCDKHPCDVVKEDHY